MTPDERKVARERCEAATPGPWEWKAADGSLLGLGTRGFVESEHVLSCPRCPACQEHGGRCLWPEKADSDFIAHARTDLPAALDQLDADDELLRRTLEALNLPMGDPVWGSSLDEVRPALRERLKGRP